MVLFVSVFFCVLNIILWILFAFKFKKIFSTDDIISKTRDELNNLLIDINHNTDRNITLIEDKIKQIKSVTAEAERRLSLLKTELDNTNKSFVFKQKLESASDSLKDISSDKENFFPRKMSSPIERYKKEQQKADFINAGKKNSQEVQEIKSEENDMLTLDLSLPHKTIEEIEDDLPSISVKPNPVEQKKDFKTKVKELYSSGESVENIALRLGRSTQEVKFALQF